MAERPVQNKFQALRGGLVFLVNQFIKDSLCEIQHEVI